MKHFLGFYKMYINWLNGRTSRCNFLPKWDMCLIVWLGAKKSVQKFLVKAKLASEIRFSKVNWCGGTLIIEIYLLIKKIYYFNIQKNPHFTAFVEENVVFLSVFWTKCSNIFVKIGSAQCFVLKIIQINEIRAIWKTVTNFLHFPLQYRFYVKLAVSPCWGYIDRS